jgi:hypothetical protein
MQFNMYSTARTSALRALSNLDAILDKAVASAEARKIDPPCSSARGSPRTCSRSPARCRSPAISARA